MSSVNTVDNLPESSPPRLDSPGVRVGALLQQGTALLAAHAEARLDAAILLAHVLGRPRSYLLSHDDSLVDPIDADAYLDLIQRRQQGMPAAYLLGEREFWSLSFAVSPAVLVPRPETELVVERCLVLLDGGSSPSLPQRIHPPSVVDLGTGSGAIALALAHEQPHWLITATDQSAAALQIARRNAVRLGVEQVEFLEGSWLEPLAARRFDLIVSNPPYIAAADPALQALRHEPAIALSPGPSGLESLLHLIAQAPAHLQPGGWLVLEHGRDQADALAAALVAAGAHSVRCHPDLAAHPRVTEAQWP